jgi:predicted XRE-type DNA-binding protein
MYHQRLKTAEEWFSEKYSVQSTGCWEWESGRGYPMFWVGDGYQKAGRYIWEKTHGVRLSSKQFVCHRCDNPRCVNVAHLFIGSQDDNMKDMASKNRRKGRCKGADNGRTKITKEIAEEIKSLYSAGSVSQQNIADKFSISQPHVSEIIRGVSW